MASKPTHTTVRPMKSLTNPRRLKSTEISISVIRMHRRSSFTHKQTRWAILERCPRNMLRVARGVDSKNSLVRALSSPVRGTVLRRIAVSGPPLHKSGCNHIVTRLTVMSLLGLAGTRTFILSPALCTESSQDRSKSSTHIPRSDSDMKKCGSSPFCSWEGVAMRFICGAAVGTVASFTVTRAALAIVGVIVSYQVASVVEIIAKEWEEVEAFFVATYIADGRVQWSKLRDDATQYIGVDTATTIVRAGEKILAYHKWAMANVYSPEFAIGIIAGTLS
ncbi:hypothetical protein H310_01128 [Aphanomyces invadans]|uniref:Uncharacterized protein n=1 Tax=Aphanomyces invadans TaxID=157072 RepID=A0A024URU7_9STRA|nr:hypothetical protein H310_01128 [Aphanomyces invadans]ETW08577.1 hypothetical protein H310_01128 [Aphanomyces invadans]|eukprot:XP_008862382.1 hypothetical protein H310_01128 [Aphanomyces invadans]